MSKRIRVELGPVPFEDYDPKSMVGETVHVQGVPDAHAPTCKIVDAWVTEIRAFPGLPEDPTMTKRLGAEVEVPDWLAEAMFELPDNAVSLGAPVGKMVPLRPVQVSSLEEFERMYGPSDELHDRLAKFGITYRETLERIREDDRRSMRYRVSGGFGSRYRVQWARGIWTLLREWRSYLDSALEGVFEGQRVEDRMAHCPHWPEWREELREDEPQYDICRACNKAFRRG